MSKQEKPDPKKLGLKCGIEIHQQLATNKLFCSCPSIIREDKADFNIQRQLRASAGESGETDLSAVHETKKKKTFVYEGYYDTTCLVELDEEPPHNMNQDAVHVGVQVAKLLNTKIFSKAQVMRKTVVDGSNTSGFQRTMLFAVNGKITGEWGSAGIEAVCLEEDSAKIVSRGSQEDKYNLSRLGIPLIEIATAPDLNTPEMIRDCAAHIGMILRSAQLPGTNKAAVKRGLGTIRQDINISIKGGARVEIKGAQDLKLIPDLVNNEMLRQESLIKLKDKLGEKNIGSPKVVDVTKEFSKATGFIGKLIEKKASVIGIKLTNAKGLLGTELYPGYRFGTEIAGYAKANGFGGIIHADEDEKKYGVEFKKIHEAFSNKQDDSWLVLVGDKKQATRVLEEVIITRLHQQGVPQEVRKANPDATTTYLRPMPGASRMYPETDIPKVELDTSIKAPKLLSEQIKDFAKTHKLSEAIAKEAYEEELFTTLIEQFPKVSSELIAQTIITTPKEIKKREKKDLTKEQLEKNVPIILEHINKIPKSAIYELLVDVANNKKIDVNKYEQVDDKEIEKVVLAVIKKDPQAPIGALMGQAMAQLRGKADGKTVMKLLQQHTKK